MKLRLRRQGRFYPEYPDDLEKACIDFFDYAVGLRDGTVIHFSVGQPSPDRRWITLTPQAGYKGESAVFPNEHGFSFERGITVRVADIMWVADAPNGS